MKCRQLLCGLLALLALLSACGTLASTGAGRARRIVAFGDVHGDLDATRRALRLAGAIDEQDHWNGGRLIVVQTGDQLDHGDGEQAILELFERLEREARAAGGAFHSLLGNHELMNVAGDFRHVTAEGFADFEDAAAYDSDEPDMAKFEPHQRARAHALRPGGPLALTLAEHDVILILEGTVFVHGGLLPEHVEYGIERINEEARQWLRGEREQPEVLRGIDSPAWTRRYSRSPDDRASATLRKTLDLLGAQRMVIGHTIQADGIRARCNGLAWCADVGMAKHYGGPIEVLEIVADRVTILREASGPDGASGTRSSGVQWSGSGSP